MDNISKSSDNPYLTQDDLKKFNDEAAEWRNEYMVTFPPFIKVGDDCEYLTRRGEWVEARAIDYVYEDRPYYVIEYPDDLGYLRREKTTSSRLREKSKKV